MTRNLLLASVALAAISGSAFAADLPNRRAPVYAPPPIPIFSWTGFYIGGQIGYGFGSDRAVTFVGGVPVALGSNPNGVIGGAHVGYNFSTQSLPVFGGVFGTGGVIGLEGDVDGSDYRRAVTLGAGGIFLPGGTASIKDGIQGSIRGRLGFAVDRALFYATGGAAFADIRTGYADPTGGFDSFSHTRVGYTVGGGIEYAITNTWSLRGEYRYSDFGRYSDTLINSAAFPGAVISHRDIEQRAQVGFSYKFDTPLAPVVARY